MDRQSYDREEERTHNSGFAKKRVQWLIEHSTRINFCGVLTVLRSEIRHCAKRQNVKRLHSRNGGRRSMQGVGEI